MPSNFIKQNSTTYTGLSLTGAEKVLKTIEKAKTPLNKVKVALQKVLKFVEPFFKLTQSNPFSTIFKTVLKTVEETLDAYLATGASLIIITPFNQKQKRTIKLKVNLLNPINEFNQTMEAIKISDKNTFLQKKITALEKQISSITDPTQLTSLTQELNKYYSELDVMEYKEKVFGFTVDIPKLSPSDAIQELIDSFSNPNDKYRPKWNTSNTVSGVGMILAAHTQIELVNKLEGLNKLFKLTSISKNYDKFKEDIDSWASTIKQKGDKQKEKLSDSPIIKSIQDYNNLSSAEKANKNKGKSLEELRSGLAKYTSSIYPPLSTTVIGDDGPRWIPFTVEVLPFVKELRNTLMDILEAMLVVTDTMDSLVKNIIETFVQKLNSIIEFIDKISETLDFLNSLKVSLSFFTFAINLIEKTSIRDVDYQVGGGVNFLIEQLKLVQTFSKDNMTALNEESLAEIKSSEFSTLVFFGMGYADYNKIRENFQKILDLFNLTFSALTPASSSATSEAEVITETPAFTVSPVKYTDYNIIFNDATYTFTVIMNPMCKGGKYSIYQNSQLIGSENAFNPFSSNFNIPFTFVANTQYDINISVWGTDINNPITKTIKFTTGASPVSAKDLSNDNDSTDEEDPSDPTPSPIDNNTSETQTVVITVDGVDYEFTVAPGQTFEIPVIWGDGVYTIKIYPDASKKYYTTTKFDNFPDAVPFKLKRIQDGNFSVPFKLKRIQDGNFPVKKLPYILYLPSSLGGFVEIIFSESIFILKLSGYVEITEDEFSISFFKNGVWSDRLLVKNKLSTNISDFCLE